MKWYHDKKAGLVCEEGRERYICRGFREEHGDILAAGPELMEKARAVCDAWEVLSRCVAPKEAILDFQERLSEAIDDLRKFVSSVG